MSEFKCAYYPMQTELSDAIYAAFNKHMDALLAVCAKFPDPESLDPLSTNEADTIAQNIYPLTGRLKLAQAKGGFARVPNDIERNTDAHNLLALVSYLWGQLPQTDRLALQPLVTEVGAAMEAEIARSGELTGILRDASANKLFVGRDLSRMVG